MFLICVVPVELSGHFAPVSDLSEMDNRYTTLASLKQRSNI